MLLTLGIVSCDNKPPAQPALMVKKLISPGARALETRDQSSRRHQVMLLVIGSKWHLHFSVLAVMSKTKKRGAEDEVEAPVKKKGKSE